MSDAGDLPLSRNRDHDVLQRSQSTPLHVRYEDFRAILGIDPLELREGKLPPRVLGLVIEWAELHQADLLQNWTTLATTGSFKRIEPLV